MLLDDVDGKWLPVPIYDTGEIEEISSRHHKFPAEGRQLRVFRPDPKSPYARL